MTLNSCFYFENYFIKPLQLVQDFSNLKTCDIINSGRSGEPVLSDRNQTYHQVQKPMVSSIRVDLVGLRFLIMTLMIGLEKMIGRPMGVLSEILGKDGIRLL